MDAGREGVPGNADGPTTNAPARDLAKGRIGFENATTATATIPRPQLGLLPSGGSKRR